MSLLAVPLVAIVVLGASPLEVAVLSALEFLPFVLISLPAGVWADRLRRRPILILADIGRAVSLGSIPLAHALGVLGMPQLYIVGFVTGALTVFFDVAYQAYLPSLVARDRILDANSKLEISRSIAQGAGPAIGGALIAVVTAPLAILADSLSFLASALFLWRIRAREHQPTAAHAGSADGAPRPSLRREVAEGLRYVLGHPSLRSIAASTSLSNLFGNISFAVYLVYLVRVLGLDPVTIGIVLGLGNVAALGGAVLADRIGRSLGVGRTVIAATLVASLSGLLVPLAPVGDPLPFLLVAGALGGLGVVVYNITQVSYRQAVTPTFMQGRMNATMRFFVWGTMPLGSLIGGLLATAVGLHETLWIGAALGLLAVVPLLATPVRRLGAMPSLALEE